MRVLTAIGLIVLTAIAISLALLYGHERGLNGKPIEVTVEDTRSLRPGQIQFCPPQQIAMGGTPVYLQTPVQVILPDGQQAIVPANTPTTQTSGGYLVRYRDATTGKEGDLLITPQGN